MVEDTQALDEVVVTGYSTQAKKDITGSVAVVKTDELKETPVSNFAEALQGKAAGVFVQAGGGPLGETTIRIRGVGSVNGSDPLIIVDGVQGVDIDAVNPNDIESMQILKDAAASAIYGAKGANGVIVITTKQGKRDDAKKHLITTVIAVGVTLALILVFNIFLPMLLDAFNVGQSVNEGSGDQGGQTGGAITFLTNMIACRV